MTLLTHAIVGAGAAAVFPTHPVIAFTTAVVSHFVLDAIPHWDYDIRSARNSTGQPLDMDMEVKSKDFLIDISKIAIDCTLGFLLAFVFYRLILNLSLPLILLCAFGGVLPDALQFAYFKIRRQPLTALQRFHHYIQRDNKIESAPLGIFFQAVIIAAVLVFVSL